MVTNVVIPAINSIFTLVPFLKTTRTKIDVHAGTLSMEFGDSIVHFNILDAMRHPSEDHSVFRAEILDAVVDE